MTAQEKKKKKKQSIREFVSEAELKFQLYLLKYTNQIKQLEEKTTEEIENKWAYDINKKINRFTKDLENPKFKDKIPQEAIRSNIEYLKTIPAPTTKEIISSNFEEQRKRFIESLEERIKNNKTGTLEDDKEMIKYAGGLVLKSSTSKEKFGVMLLLIIKNLATMPSFSGYSDNWKTDFFSNAIEKTLLYLDNFDENLLSKRTGKKSNAFAYVTQISFNAFVNIINIRKKEEEFLKDTISLEVANLDGVRNFSTAPLTDDFETEVHLPKEYIKTIKDIDELDRTILEGLEYIEKSNKQYFLNSSIKEEIDYLILNTPEKEKTKDFYSYIIDLREKIKMTLENYEIEVLKIIKPESVSLGNWQMPKNNFPEVPVIITNSFNKVKKNKKIRIKSKEIVEINEIEEFENEW